LPVLNHASVDHAIRAALALGCAIHESSIFARKNYFYPDLPKGYQISQYAQPLATGGVLEYTSGGGHRRSVRITRVHLEEDAGKSLHEGFPDSDRKTYLDFNRSGVPLIEIVTEPDLRSAVDAAEFFTRLRSILVWLGVNDGNMEQGSLRCDANVSVRPATDPLGAAAAPLGTKTEVKNLNSFRFLQKALEYEIGRQNEVLNARGRVVQETRLWDAAAGVTVPMRSKEEAHDYRYFPEPDLPPLDVEAPWIETIRATLPELPAARRERFMEAYGLGAYDADLLTGSRALADYFESTVRACGKPKAAANWVLNELLRELPGDHERALAECPIPPANLADLITLVEDGTISGRIAKDVFEKMYRSREDARTIVSREGLTQVADADELSAVVDQVLAQHAKVVLDWKNGKRAARGFLVGQVMKATAGKASPAVVNSLLDEKLPKV